jgi:hypothetical protein
MTHSIASGSSGAGPTATTVGPVSPHNKALYEAGKALLTESVTTGRQFCKDMITVSTGAIPLYLALLAFILPKDYRLGLGPAITVVVPAVMFLIAAAIFVFGYLPVTGEFSLDLPDEIERELSTRIMRRNKFIVAGASVLGLAMLLAILAVMVNLGVR